MSGKTLPANVTVIRPECQQLQALFTQIRDRETHRTKFVEYSNRIIRMLIEAVLSKQLTYTKKTITTATGVEYEGLEWDGKVCGVSIMRAGESMELVLREMCPGARIGKILIQRNEASEDKAPDSQYSYAKLPDDIATRKVLLLDPMLATGGSAKAALATLIGKYKIPEEQITFVNLVSCPEGLAALAEAYPKVNVFTACVDSHLNEDKYIVPGLGDFGDRYFGTCH
jgi:uracil phosphoribosyltransferase